MRRQAVCLLVLAAGAAAAVATGSDPVPAKATVTSTVTGTALPTLASFSFDFWLRNDTVYGEKWGNSSCLTVDLQDPDLIALASGLAPAVLRLGGSPEDSVVFDTGGCVPGQPFEGYGCSQTGAKVYGCLTPSRWEELLSFAHTTGVKLVYGLNACYGRATPNSPMDISNAKAMMEYTVGHVDPAVSSALLGFEVGNEVSDKINATVMGQDVARLHATAAATWASSSNPTPILIAPDADRIDHDYYQGLVAAANADGPGNIQAVTYHQYPNCESQAGVVFPLSCMEKLKSPIATLLPVAKAAGIQLWAGEGAEHSGGGILGLTNTFASSFYTSYKLCTLSRLGVSLSVRQCIMGGDYELVNHTTMVPNPDYWTTWMYKNIVGTSGYHVDQDPSSLDTGLRVFGNTDLAGTGTAVTIVNFSTTTSYAVSLALSKPSKGVKTEYHLTGDLKGIDVAVNGHTLRYSAGALPAFPTGVTTQAGEAVQVAAASIVFVHVEGSR